MWLYGTAPTYARYAIRDTLIQLFLCWSFSGQCEATEKKTPKVTIRFFKWNALSYRIYHRMKSHRNSFADNEKKNNIIFQRS